MPASELAPSKPRKATYILFIEEEKRLFRCVDHGSILHPRQDCRHTSAQQINDLPNLPHVSVTPAAMAGVTRRVW